MAKIDRNSAEWIKKPYPYVWIVMFRRTRHEDFEAGGIAWSNKKDAQDDCRLTRGLYGKGNAYVQMYGPIS